MTDIKLPRWARSHEKIKLLIADSLYANLEVFWRARTKSERDAIKLAAKKMCIDRGLKVNLPHGLRKS